MFKRLTRRCFPSSDLFPPSPNRSIVVVLCVCVCVFVCACVSITCPTMREKLNTLCVCACVSITCPPMREKLNILFTSNHPLFKTGCCVKKRQSHCRWTARHLAHDLASTAAVKSTMAREERESVDKQSRTRQQKHKTTIAQDSKSSN